MTWTELSILTTHEAVDAVTNILHEAGASGVVIEDSKELDKERIDKFGEIYALDPADFPKTGVVVKAYLSASSFLSETIEEIKLAVANLVNFDINIGENLFTLCEVDEEDWATAWKQYYHPVKISERFTIVPTWEDYQPVSTDELIIELDPGMAFGTGTHPTTVMCLQGLEKVVKAEVEADEPSVIIAQRPCALLKTVKYEGHCTVTDKCKNCKMCMKLGCPAISITENGPKINDTLCVGCGVCKQLCKFGAIE